MGKSVVARRLLVGIACIALFQDKAWATDMTGHWLAEPKGSGNGIQFDISQVGDLVTIPLPAISAYLLGSGTLQATLSGSTLDGQSGRGHFRARVLASGAAIDGDFQGLFGPATGDLRLFATRCECFDGNVVDGDGCDANCRVEPCYVCDGEPSTCTPLPDGAACSDHRDCTSGETCSAGVCGGGAAEASCIDVTGRWKVQTSGGDPAYLLEDLRDVEQRDGIVRFRLPGNGGLLAEIGTINPATGVLDLSGGVLPGKNPYTYRSLNDAIESCAMSFAGTVSPDGQFFSGSGGGRNSTVYYIGTSGVFPGGCSYTDPVVSFSQTAQRCAPGDCLTAPAQCPPCTRRDETGSCVLGPREDCLRSLAPRRSRIRMLTDGEDLLSWRWSNGMEVASHALGDFSQGSGVQVCIFDGNSNVLFETYWNPTELEWGWEDGGWGTKDGVLFKRKVDSFGRLRPESIALRSGGDGDSGISVSATEGGLATGVDSRLSYYSSYIPRHVPLPPAPYDLPLIIQAQVDRGGACFQSTFESTGVKTNADGTFQAKATQ